MKAVITEILWWSFCIAAAMAFTGGIARSEVRIGTLPQVVKIDTLPDIKPQLPVTVESVEASAKQFGEGSASAKALAEYRRRKAAGENVAIFQSGSTLTVGPTKTTVCQCGGKNHAVCLCLKAGIKCGCTPGHESEWNLNDKGQAVSKTGKYIDRRQSPLPASVAGPISKQQPGRLEWKCFGPGRGCGWVWVK